MPYAGAGVRNLPTTGIPSVDKGFYAKAYIFNIPIRLNFIVAETYNREIFLNPRPSLCIPGHFFI